MSFGPIVFSKTKWMIDKIGLNQVAINLFNRLRQIGIV